MSAEDVIRKEDLEVTVTRSGIFGRQSHVTIRHVPTDLMAHCGAHQSEIQNKVEALKTLRRALKSQGWTPPHLNGSTDG